MTNDPNHTANQYAVARKLVAVLSGPFADADAVQVMGDDGWKATVALARMNEPDWQPRKGYLPSESTKRLVAAMIRAETTPTPTTDPFEGLGT